MQNLKCEKKLDERHEVEREFHDDWARTIDISEVYVRESFEAESALENRAVMRFLGDVSGKRVLDLGCGAGEASVYLAMNGAEVFSVDLSEEMLKKTRDLARHHGVEVQTFSAPAEKLGFDDDFFDCIYGSSILHHADLHLTIKEAARVMKKDGKAVFIEPLSYNPVINVYRKIAEDVRTPTEVAFSFKDFQCVQNDFKEVSFDFCWLTSLSVFLYMFFVERISPTQDRYWKRVVREHARYAKMFNRLNRLDRRILKIFPFLKYMCWTTVIKLSGKKG